jgi:hypothetical protein
MSTPDEVPVSITDQRLRETEQLLREAFAAAAQSVTPTAIRVPRPADRLERSWHRWLPWVRTRRRSWDRRLRLPRLYEQVLIPLAAAAAITVIATAMTVVVPKAFSAAQGSHGGVAQMGPAGVRPAKHPARPAAVAHASDLAAAYPGGHVPHAASPRFFVGIRQLSATSEILTTGLAVYSAATGRVVASVAQPGRGRYYQAVAALGSDQSFVVAATPARGPGCHTWFYRFSLGPQGRPKGWAPLAVPEVTGEIRYNNALATSGDGNVLAYSASTCAQNSSSQVGVIHLDTRKVRTWSTLWPAVPRNLSLSADGTLLSFVGNPSSGTKNDSQVEDTVWTLRTDAAPGPVASRYRKVLHAPGGVQSAILSPTGAITFAMTASNPRRPTASENVNAYDTATGKPLGLVQAVRYLTDGPGFTPDASGQYVLVYPRNTPLVQELNLTDRRLMTVSVPAVPIAVAW